MKRVTPKVLKRGIIPCRRCGRPHVELSLGKGNSTWENLGHAYWAMDPLKYVVDLLAEQRRLKRLLAKTLPYVRG